MRDDANAAQNERYEVEVVIPPRPLLGGEASKRKRHLELYGAAVKGDWGTAKSIFDKFPEDIQARISKAGDTALHIAAAANRTLFVKELVNSIHMNVDYLATENYEQNTAFCLVAAAGNMELVDLMLVKNGELARTRGKKNMLPIQMAALLGKEKMVQHLYYKARKGKDYLVKEDDLIELLVTLINNYLYAEVAAGSAAWLGQGLSCVCAQRESDPRPSFDLTPVQEECLQSLQNHIDVTYDSSILEHQEALRALWNASFTEEELSGLISEQWKEMDWQGKDPSTDFR